MKFKEYIEEAKEDNLLKRIKNAKDRKDLDNIRDLFIGMELKNKLKKKIKITIKNKYDEFTAQRR